MMPARPAGVSGGGSGCRTVKTSGLAALIGGLGNASFEPELLHFVNSEVDFDGSVALTISPARGEVLCTYSDLSEAEQRVLEYTGLQNLWPASPLYRLAISGFTGGLHLTGFSRTGRFSTAFCRDHPGNSQTVDQFAFFARLENGACPVLLLQRSASMRRYSGEEIDALLNLGDIVCALMEKHYQGNAKLEARVGHKIRRDPSNLLEIPEADSLTPRETEVLNAIMLGQPNKTIARELGITTDTVKTYCKNINRKLSISGRHEIHGMLVRKLMTDGWANGAYGSQV